MKWIIAAGAALAMGFLAGAWVQGAREQRALQGRLDSLAGEVRELAILARQAPPPVQMDERQLQGLAGELAARLPGRKPEVATAPMKPAAEDKAHGESRQATPEQRQAAERAAEIIDDAIARHALSPDDIAALRLLAPRLEASAQEAMRLRIVVAINRQQLALDPRAGLP